MRRRLLLALFVVAAIIGALLPGVRSEAAPTRAAFTASAKTLILFDTSGQWGFLGEQYATQTANLASRYGTWTAHPASAYKSGEVNGYTSLVYIGSTYDEPLPNALLDDVLKATKPVLWIGDNIWRLSARSTTFAATYGWTPGFFDTSAIPSVTYKGRTFTRSLLNAGGILGTTISTPAKVTVLANGKRSNGTTIPWALKSGKLTYVTENPYAYSSENDRYVAFAGILQNTLAPGLPARHRALVRIEDVGPDANPASLKAIADYLYAQQVPFSVAVYGFYRDPTGAYNGGVPEEYHLSQTPQVVAALKYMVARGGSLLYHGWTHQYSNVPNPYDAVSANDFEFWRAHVDKATDNVVYDGPIPGDSTAWATSRINSAKAELSKVGLPAANIFEFPHYAASAADYQAAKATTIARYDRGLYFSGLLGASRTSGQAPGAANYARPIFGQFFPWPVTDVYGEKVVPENLGNEELDSFNNHPPRLPKDLIANAQLNLAINDGMASFFFHPFLPLNDLKTIVAGIKGLGYTFESPTAVLNEG